MYSCVMSCAGVDVWWSSVDRYVCACRSCIHVICLAQVWMCGGQVLIATCARVGHVFRKVSPYTWPGGVVKILNHNTLRTVEVWMDRHKEFFYKINPGIQLVIL